MAKKTSSLKSTLVSYFKDKKENNTDAKYNIKPTSREKKFLNYYSKSPIKIQPFNIQIPSKVSNDIISQPTPEPTQPKVLQKSYILPEVNGAVSNLIKRLNGISFNRSIENKNINNKIYNTNNNILRTKNSTSFEKIIKSISKLNTPTIINVPKVTKIDNTKDPINIPKVTKIDNTKDPINIPKVTKIENVSNKFNKNISTKLINKNSPQNKTMSSNTSTIDARFVNKTTTPNHIVSKVLNRFIENETNNIHNSNTRPALPKIIPSYAKGGYVDSPTLIMAGDSKSPSGGKEGEHIIPESLIERKKIQDIKAERKVEYKPKQQQEYKPNPLKIEKNNIQNPSTASALSIDKNTHLKMNKMNDKSSDSQTPIVQGGGNANPQDKFNSSTPRSSSVLHSQSDFFFRTQTQYPKWRQRIG